MRIQITNQQDTPYTIEQTDRAWRAIWDEFEQDKIRILVIRQAVINTLILEYEGGNEFHG